MGDEEGVASDIPSKVGTPRQVPSEEGNKLPFSSGKVIVFSGYFDPLHVGHLEGLQLAKGLGGRLVVIVNSDKQAVMKKGFAFMPEDERMKIIEALECVDEVVLSIDEDQTQCKTLAMIKPDIFAKGGDRHAGEIPEGQVCRDCGIKIVDGLGAKIQSSSELAERAKMFEKEN